jgi:hypothetical protein
LEEKKSISSDSFSIEDEHEQDLENQINSRQSILTDSIEEPVLDVNEDLQPLG